MRTGKACDIKDFGKFKKMNDKEKVSIVQGHMTKLSVAIWRMIDDVKKEKNEEFIKRIEEAKEKVVDISCPIHDCDGYVCQNIENDFIKLLDGLIKELEEDV